MKLYLFLFAILTLNTADASTLTPTLGLCTQIDCNTANFTPMVPTACGTNYTLTCYQTSAGHIMGFADCHSCINSSYELNIKSTTCGSRTYTYKTCCPVCADCTSDTTWRNVTLKPSHQQKTTRSCDCGTCVETTQYRCAPGYYGNPTTISGTCTRCPPNDGAYGTTDYAGSTAIDSCYIKKDVPMTNDGNTYVFTENCPYKN